MDRTLRLIGLSMITGLLVGCIGGGGGGGGGGSSNGSDGSGGGGSGSDGGTTTLAAIDPPHFFAGNDGSSGNPEASQLWLTDGTEDGTVMVRDIHPSGDAAIDEFTRLGGALYFVADDGTGAGPQLWKSDGTESGTGMVKAIDLVDDARPHSLTAVGDTLFFVAEDDTSGEELWKSDGTADGTVLVKNIRGVDLLGNPAGSSPVSLTAMGGTLYFVANDNEVGPELWRSDGTEDGTEIVKVIREGRDGGLLGVFGPQAIVVVDDDMLYFAANDGNSSTGGQLWKSDGTAGGTVLVKNFGVGFASLTAAGDQLYLYAGGDFWTSDGTEDGTVIVQEGGDAEGTNIEFFESVYATPMGVIGDTVYFAARDDTTDGFALWRGNTSGVSVVANIEIGQGGFNRFVAQRISVEGAIYSFTNSDDFTGLYRFWSSDGTANGTGTGQPFFQQTQNNMLTVAEDGETLLFGARDLATGKELWRSNGEEAGTQLITEVCPGNCDGFISH
ncbi:ELWxxDGT repeat protein [Natronocella acetinitrilica]|uniref:ELWxxDGT repeat protein n=1 Tax=Natronocella acetinitrilica TaxID=414046 RepID=A0AAE3KAC2_9GAMM|nr:hypothetical protein [Natronocella acetinitrilica]MCP1673221.1 ELWxxDGT repeat protein [Natronocella acetinitrilica]